MNSSYYYYLETWWGEEMLNAIYHKFFFSLDLLIESAALLFNILECSTWIEHRVFIDLVWKLDAELSCLLVVLGVRRCLLLGFGGAAVPLHVDHKRQIIVTPPINSPSPFQRAGETDQMTFRRYTAAAAHQHLCLLHLPPPPAQERHLLCHGRLLSV